MNFNSKRFLLASLSAATVLSSLTACAPFVVGSAVMSGLVAIDRRTTGIQLAAISYIGTGGPFDSLDSLRRFGP